MARERYLVGVDPEELKPRAPLTPMTPKGKWENFWYHYKWFAIGGLFLAVVLTVVIIQAVTRVKPDYTVCVVTQQEWSPYAVERLSLELEAVGKDLNGDGHVSVSVQVFNVSEKSSNAVANRTAVQLRISTEDVRLFVMDPEYYTEILMPLMEEGTQFFAPLSVPTVSGVSEDRLYWNWQDSSLLQLPDMQAVEAWPAVPKNMHVCLRNRTDTSEKELRERQAYEELLSAFIAAHAE